MQTYITENFRQTQKLGELLAMELQGREVICLEGELGAGKTTFTQGLLKGLKVKGPYTSPTFVVMKEYRVTRNVQPVTQSKNKKKFQVSGFKFKVVLLRPFPLNYYSLSNKLYERLCYCNFNLVLFF